MTIPQRKLQPLALPDPHVRRTHLVRLLDAARVGCLTAPAGYGKTALLAEYLNGAAGRRAWYTLDLADRDPAVLLSGLAAALHAPRPGGTERPDLAVADLCRWLEAQPTATTLVLDDLHVLADEADSCHLLGELLTGVPPNVRLLLAGRTPPPIPSLPRLRVMGWVRDLGSTDLAFSRVESQLFLAALGYDAEAAGSLHERVQGWPAALRFLTVVGTAGQPLYTDLFDYLAVEVLAGLPAERQRFLVEVSVLRAWTAAACDWVLARAGSRSELEWLHRTQFLVTPGQDGELRPHSLWHDFLRAQLGRDPLRHRQLQRRAALWESDQGELEAALAHALAAADPGLVEPLLRSSAGQLLRAGQLERLEAWLAATPESVVETMPDLLLSFGEALRQAGRPRRAVHWLHRAVAGFAGGDPAGGLLRALCRLALAHGDLGEWNAAQTALRQAEAELTDVPGIQRAEVLLALAEEQAAGGQGEAAARRFREAADLFARYGEPQRAGAALAGLGGRALVASGHPKEALVALRKAQELLEGAAACDAQLAEVQLLAGLERWDEVADLLPRVAPSSLPQQALRHWLQARLAIRRGDLPAAERLYEQGDRCLAAVDRTPALICAGLLTRAWLDQRSGHPGVALPAARQAGQMAELAGIPLLRAAARDLLAALDAPALPSSGLLRIDLLGTCRVLSGDQEIGPDTWGRARAREIFQFLLLQPGYMAGREVILEAFWPEAEAERSRGLLRVTLSRLRKTLQGVGCDLETTADMVRLPTGAVEWLDLAAFRSHLVTARRTVSDEPAICLEHCRAGRALHRGDLLSDLFWPWVEEERGRVRRELMELLQLWQEAAQRLGRSEEAIAVLEDLLVLEPGWEEAERQLMALLASTGRRGEALRRYRRLARWLKAELGLDPAPETRAVLKQWL